MVFNLLRGHNPGLDVISGKFSDITGPKINDIPLTVTPLAAILRTVVGGKSEIAVYYRHALGADMTLVTGGSAPANTRLYSESSRYLAVLTSGASKANAATVEYFILGVKKE